MHENDFAFTRLLGEPVIYMSKQLKTEQVHTTLAKQLARNHISP
jgi:hypothetical protein